MCKMNGVFILCVAATLLDVTPTIETQSLPSIIEFFAQLFHVDIDQVATVVRSFDFTENVTYEGLYIIQYLSDGSNISISLNSDDPRSNLQFDDQKETVIITHGYMGSPYSNWTQLMAASYLKKFPNSINVFALNWVEYSGVNYFASASATKYVGNLLGKWLTEKLQISDLLNRLHLVGHSLGAHVSGFAGKIIQDQTGTQLARITGLDVAAPLFEYPIRASTNNRLAVGDAVVVDAYHTNAGFMGFVTRIANQDFYINRGGPIQPGCDRGINVFESFVCSHRFSELVFNNSIANSNLIAKQCSTGVFASLGYCDDNLSVIMGESNNGTSLDGKFYGYTDANGNSL